MGEASSDLGELLGARPRDLAEVLRAGRAVAPAAILGWQYRGTSLGLPGWIERLAWKRFVKAFHCDAHGRLRGWNVRLHQEPAVDGTQPWRPKIHRGVPVTFGHFAVVPAPARYPVPPGALLLDYGLGGNRRGDPTGAMRDPIVALDDRGDVLLGCTLLEVAGRLVQTPSYFLLERGPHVGHVPYPPRG